MTNHLQIKPKNVSIWRPWWGPVFVILIVLVGYYKIFLGYNFFIHEDWIAISSHTAGNKFSNGWRPEKGLGIANFYGDPGMWHPWSLYSWWERITPDRIFAHVSVVIIMGILCALAIYFFNRRFFPHMNVWVAIVLSPVVIFCFGQPSEHYARSFIAFFACATFFIWLLYNFYQDSRRVHFFAAALVFWLAAFLGNLWVLTQLWMLGLVFSLCYRCYFKMAWGVFIKKFFTLYVAAAVMFLLLGAYVFYSFGLEQAVVGYVREKIIPFPSISVFPDYKKLIFYLSGFFPFEALPINHDLAAMFFLPYRQNVSPVFIFIFLFFLSRKADNFWEFAIKTLLAVYFIHGFLDVGKLLPGYSAIYNFISNKTSKIISMYDFVFGLQTLMIIMFVATVQAKNVVIENKLGRRLQVLIASGTVACYGAMLILALTSQVFPQQFLALADNTFPSLLPSQLAGYSRELLAIMFSYNARRFQELVTPELIAFFVMTIVVVGVFLKDSWLRRVAGLNKAVLAGVILANGFLLSWALYPPTNEPWVWQDPAVKTLRFEATDRFYFVRYNQWEKTPEGFRRKFMDVGGGHREPLVGFLETPGINMSGFRSFNTKAEVKFMNRIFAEVGQEYERLYYGTYFLHSDLLDMAAVKYYYSDGPLKDLPSKLTPYAQFKQLYIYKNNAAWPYFYLADRLDVDRGELAHPVQGTAYLAPEDMFAFPERTGKRGMARMTHFGSGTFKFNVQSRNEELLVLADAWHPFWKATANGRSVPVLKVNEVFKGVRLPAGQYEVTLNFDTTPYKPGIYISLVAWLLFLTGFIFFAKDRRRIGFLEVK